MSIPEKTTPVTGVPSSLKEKTDEFIDEGEFSLESDFSDDDMADKLSNMEPKDSFSSTHRKKLEEYLDECRLKREISDDFDF